MEEEIKILKKLLEDKEIERAELGNLVGELKETIFSQKNRIEEMIELNEKLELLVRTHKSALDSKDEQIRLTEAETQILQRNSLTLGDKLAATEERAKEAERELEKTR